MGEELGIFPSPGAIIEGENDFALSSPTAYKGGEAHDFSSPTTYMRECSDLFQVPRSLYSLFYFAEPHISSGFPHTSLHIS